MQLQVEVFTNPINPAVLVPKNFSFSSGGGGGGPVDLSVVIARLDTIILGLTAIGAKIISLENKTMDKAALQLNFDGVQATIGTEATAIVNAISAHP